MSVKYLKEIATNFSVMCVEDEEFLRESVTKLLGLIFPMVYSASNGKEALEIYNSLEKKPDIIITDINMPLMNGIELTKTLKSLNPEQRVIILSAHNESNLLLELINLGADGFLLKPLQAEYLDKLLTKHLKALNDSLMLRFYQEDLEKTIIKLEAKQKTINFQKADKAKTYNQQAQSIEKVIRDSSSIDEFYSSLEFEDIEEFRDNLADFDTYIVTQEEKESIDLALLSLSLKGTAMILLRWSLFSDIGNSMVDFANDLTQQEIKIAPKNVKLLVRYIESMLGTLESIVQTVLLKESENPTFYNQSLISDLEQIKNLIIPQEATTFTDIEFF